MMGVTIPHHAMEDLKLWLELVRIKGLSIGLWKVEVRIVKA